MTQDNGFPIYPRDKQPTPAHVADPAPREHRAAPPMPISRPAPPPPPTPPVNLSAPVQPAPMPPPGAYGMVPYGPAPIPMVPEKSPVVAALLGLFFGPLGMLYSTAVGALVMLGINVLTLFLTFGIGLILTIPIGAVWAAVAADEHNKRARAPHIVGYRPH
ncbi:hypothetical protein [Mariniluteicoccus endophyticus]